MQNLVSPMHWIFSLRSLLKKSSDTYNFHCAMPSVLYGHDSMVIFKVLRNVNFLGSFFVSLNIKTLIRQKDVSKRILNILKLS